MASHAGAFAGESASIPDHAGASTGAERPGEQLHLDLGDCAVEAGALRYRELQARLERYGDPRALAPEAVPLSDEDLVDLAEREARR